MLSTLWKNGVVRSAVGASATTALVATMMFSGGGFNPAVASPTDNQNSGVEQQLLDAVGGSSANVDSGAKKPETPADAPTSTGAYSPAANAQAEEASKAPAEKKPAAPAKAVEPKKQESEKPAAPAKAPSAPLKKDETDDKSAATLADDSSNALDAPVLDRPLTAAQSRVALAAADPVTKNPALPQKCGLKIAIVLDLSNSLSDKEVTQSKNAAKGMVDALQGTPSSVGLYTFATFAPDKTNSSLASTSVSTVSGANTVRTAIENLKRVPSNVGGTNWDKGLSQIPTGAYDMILFVTDGNPTAYGVPGTDGNNDLGTEFDQNDLDTAVKAANDHKRAGTFVMGLAVGSSVNENNIKKISGNVKNQDYYLIADYSKLAAQLKEIALKNCKGTVTVVKEVRDIDGQLAPSIGWKISSSTGQVAPSVALTAADGTANFTVGGLDNDPSRTVTFSEEQKAGFELEAQGGENAVCVDNSSNQKLTVTNSGATGFSVSVNRGAAVSCTIINAEKSTSLQVNKTWMINGQAATSTEAAEMGASAAPKLTPAPKTGQPAFGEVVEGFKVGASVNINETFSPGDRCVAGKQIIKFGSAAAQPLTSAGLDAKLQLGENIATITNEINCDATLTLIKKVDNKGSEGAAATEWKLSAIKSGGNTNLENVETGTSKNVVAGTYKLSEANGPSGYDFTDLTCVNGKTPISGVDKANPNVALKVGDNVTCTFTNSKIEYKDLTVSKTVTGSFDRDYDWTIDKKVADGQQKVSSATKDVPFNYEVEVVASAAKDNNFKLSGEITVSNPNKVAFESVTIADSLPNATCKITTTDNKAVTGPVSIPSGETTFKYSCDMPAGTTATTTGINTATAAWDKANYFGTTGKASGTQPFDFSKVTPKITDDQITVTDNKFDLSTLPGGNLVKVGDSPKTFDYELSWPGEVGECKKYTNTATFTGAGGGSDSETVELCIGADLTVSKNVVSSFDRSYLWNITKTAKGGAPYTADPKTGKVSVEYDVTVAPQDPSYTDSRWAMSGTVSVANPNKWQDVMATVTDSVDVGAGAVCTVTGIVGSEAGDADLATDGFQANIPKGKTVEFTYNCDFAQQPNYTGSNTATVTWDAASAATPSGSSAKNVQVSEDHWVQTPLNDKIIVTDSNHKFDPAWEITWSAGMAPQTKTYSAEWTVTAEGTCQQFDNTATFTGNNGATGSSTSNIEACRTAGLSVEKTADANFDRTYLWGIEKSLADGQDATVNTGADGKAKLDYTIVASSKGYTDSNKTLSGSITVSNSNLFGGDVEVTVSDNASLEGLTCSIDNSADVNTERDGVQVMVPQATTVEGKIVAGSASVGYNCDASSVTEGDYTGQSNTAEIEWNNGANAASSKPVAIDFEVKNETDKSVEVFDDEAKGGSKLLGSVSWDEVKDLDPRAKSFEHSLTHTGVTGKCTTFTNTAWVELAGDIENPSDSADATVCNQAGLTVSKTAAASFDREYFWELAKKADETKVVTAEDKATFKYAVTATPNGYKDKNHSLSGEITLANPNQFEGGAITATVTDVVDIKGLTCKIDAVDVDEKADGLQVVIPAGNAEANGELELTYSCAENPASYTGTNTVKVSWVDAQGVTQETSATAPVAYELGQEDNKTVEIFDNKVTQSGNGVSLGTATWNAEKNPEKFTYSLELPAIAGVCTDYTNTAIIAGTGNKASESVTVCNEQALEISKSVNASFDRDYDWKVEKEADSTSFNVDGDGKVTADYKVTASQNGYTDSKWALGGNITVKNPNKFGSITATVEDQLSLPGVQCTITGADADADKKLAGFQVVLDAGKSATLDYTCDVTSGVAEGDYARHTKAATATWGENRSVSSEPVAVKFELDQATDTEVTVVDDKTNPAADPVKLGTVSLKDAPRTFEYNVELAGEAGKCSTFTNTAVIQEEAGSDADNTDTATVEVCVEKELIVVKTVDAQFTRDYDWKIAKEADKTSFTVDGNGKATANYTVTATQTGHTDQDWTMSGEIDVFNPNQQGEMKVNVADVAGITGAVCTVEGGGQNVLVPAATLVEGKVVSGKATVAYDCELPEKVDAADYEGKKNTATISWTGVDGKPRTADFAAEIDFKQTKSIDSTVTVVDDKTVPGAENILGTATLDESAKEFTYSVDLAGVAGQCTTYTNTALLQETAGANDDNTANAVVTVCANAELSVSKSAEASFDREYLWKLAKEVKDPKSVDIALDGSANFDYTVTATPDGYEDSAHSLTGKITLVNPNQFDSGAITATVEDVVDIKGLVCAIEATDVDKDAKGLQVLVPAKGSVELAYTCEGVPAETDYSGTNTVNVSWTNSAGETATMSAIAPVEFTQVGSKNHSVEVFDDKAGTVDEPELLGTAIWNAEKNPTKFTYQLDFVNSDAAALSGTCTEYTNVATIPAAEKSASETVEVCVKVGAPTVEKTVTGTTQNADGTWEITYDVVVTGDKALKGRYSLEDTLRFGAGITVNSAAWTGPVEGDGDAWDLAAPNLTEVMATDKLIDAKGIDTYKVTVNASVAQGTIGSEAGNCELTDGEEGTGFLNSATITANGQKNESEACAVPTLPNATKTFVSAVQQDDASWVVKYSLVVDNSAGKDGFYDLSDTPDFASGIAINGRTVSTPEGITVAGDQSNGLIVADQAIKAGETHAYGVEFAVTVPVTGIPAGDLTCEPGVPGKGFFNKATLTSGNDDVISEACGPVEEGGVPSVTKDVIGTEQLVDGSWNITYEVRAKANADFATKYDLVDELKFGADIKINSASWTGLTNGEFVDGKATMANGKVLAKGAADDIYTVTVNASVPTKVIGTEAGNCELIEGETGTGFLNSATISNGDWNSSDEACATPTEMKISKDAVSDAVQQENGSWNVAYLVNVDNTDGHAGVYSLSDIPAFSKGVSINNWSVQAEDTDTPSIDLVEQAYTDGVIRTDQGIDANAKHSYRVTFNVDVALADSVQNATCGAEGGEAGNGFFNSAELIVGKDKTEDTDCVEVPKVGAPTVEKTVTGTNQDANGNWVVSYQVRVKATGENTSKYTLEDTLAYGDGATILEAAWTGPGEGESGTWENPNEQRTAALATDRLIKAGTTDIYTVNVVASVAKGATGTPGMDCRIGEGEDGQTGFLNTVKLGNGDTTIGTDEACATPAAPVFDKQALELVQHEDATGNWDGTWDASYTLRVTNPATEGQQVNYELSDTPAFAKGVIVNDRNVSSDDVAVNEGWHGKDSTDDVIISGQVLDAGATHNFNVIINVSLTADINDADRVCAAEGTEGGNGLLNTGTVNSGNESSTDDACLEIPAPSSNVVKTAVSSEENADGSWDIHYTVVVNNTSDVAARYDLADTLRFGAGITATNANWSLEGTEEAGNWENPGTEPSTVLAKGRDLEARDSHTYLVHVVANLEDGVIGSEAGTCQTEDSETNGGFLNEATLVANGKTSASRDCLAPEKNPRGYSMVKTADPSNGTVMWPGEDINYTITVRNTGEFVYPDAVVTDEMAGWQQAATLKEGSLKLSGGESVIEGSKLIWTVGELEVGESKTLTYTITVNDEAWDQMLVNVATGSGDVPPSKTTHPTPEYHKLPEPPVVIVPPVVPTPEPVLPGTETKVPPRKPVPPLASTGASNATLWIVGSGALVLLLGTGFMMVARRRKSEQN